MAHGNSEGAGGVFLELPVLGESRMWEQFCVCVCLGVGVSLACSGHLLGAVEVWTGWSQGQPPSQSHKPSWLTRKPTPHSHFHTVSRPPHRGAKQLAS